MKFAMRACSFRFVFVPCAACAAIARPAWTVTDLHPANTLQSIAWSVRGGAQAGVLRDNQGISRASLWTGTAASWVDLHPGVALASGASKTDGTQTVGEVRLFTSSTVDRASLWTGSAASWVDLHPTGADYSLCRGVDQGTQAGTAAFSGQARASTWTGTAASRVDLHPGVASQSFLYGIRNGVQVGYATVGGVDQAGLWTGTAASYVSLHVGSASATYAWETDGAQQVGRAVVGGSWRASLWSGTAASWVDLTPGFASDAEVTDVENGWQAGWVKVGGLDRASVWNGTAASWVDLHDPNYLETRAYSIWSDANFTYVAGWGVDSTTFITHALLWKQPVPEPGTLLALAAGIGLLARRRR